MQEQMGVMIDITPDEYNTHKQSVLLKIYRTSVSNMGSTQAGLQHAWQPFVYMF